MKATLRPNKAEKEFLSLAYNRFYDLFDEVMADLWGHFGDGPEIYCYDNPN